MVTDLGDDAPVVRLDRKEFMIALLHFIARAGRNLAQPGPGEAIVLRFGHADLAVSIPELLADVEEATVLQLRRAVRTVDDGSDGRRPSLAAIRRAQHPFAQLGFALLGRQTVLRGFPAGLTFRSLLRKEAAFLVGQRCKCRDEQRPFGGLHHAAVAVVDWAVEEHTRVGPRRAVILGGHRLHLPERTDMAVAAAGPTDPELTVSAARQRRPAGIGFFGRRDRLRLEHLGRLGAQSNRGE